jgi:hypothetical protein
VPESEFGLKVDYIRERIGHLGDSTQDSDKWEGGTQKDFDQDDDFDDYWEDTMDDLGEGFGDLDATEYDFDENTKDVSKK